MSMGKSAPQCSILIGIFFLVWSLFLGHPIYEMFFFFHSFLVNCNHTGCTEESCSTATHECKINCLVKCSGSSDQVCVFVLSLGSGLFALDKTKYKHKSMEKYKGLVFVHAFVFVSSLFPCFSIFSWYCPCICLFLCGRV